MDLSRSGRYFLDRYEIVRLKRKIKLFTAPASPQLTIEALNWLSKLNKIKKDQDKPVGYRNALYILMRFNLIVIKNGNYCISSKLDNFKSYEEAIWTCASKEESIIEVIHFLDTNSSATKHDIGHFIAEKHSLIWSETSKSRNGFAIKQWASWIKLGQPTNS